MNRSSTLLNDDLLVAFQAWRFQHSLESMKRGAPASSDTLLDFEQRLRAIPGFSDMERHAPRVGRWMVARLAERCLNGRWLSSRPGHYLLIRDVIARLNVSVIEPQNQLSLYDPQRSERALEGLPIAVDRLLDDDYNAPRPAFSANLLTAFWFMEDVDLLQAILYRSGMPNTVQAQDAAQSNAATSSTFQPARLLGPRFTLDHGLGAINTLSMVLHEPLSTTIPEHARMLGAVLMELMPPALLILDHLRSVPEVRVISSDWLHQMRQLYEAQRLDRRSAGWMDWIATHLDDRPTKAHQGGIATAAFTLDSLTRERLSQRLATPLARSWMESAVAENMTFTNRRSKKRALYRRKLSQETSLEAAQPAWPGGMHQVFKPLKERSALTDPSDRDNATWLSGLSTSPDSHEEFSASSDADADKAFLLNAEEAASTGKTTNNSAFDVQGARGRVLRRGGSSPQKSSVPARRARRP